MTGAISHFQDDTIFVHWFYGGNESTQTNGPLDDVGELHQGSKTMFLKNPSALDEVPEAVEDVKVLELLNQDVDLPAYDNTLYWCRIFKFNEFVERSQLIKVSRFDRCLSADPSN